MNSIQFAAYRTAMKMRHLQKTINADLIELKTVDHVFRAKEKMEEGSEITVYENKGEPLNVHLSFFFFMRSCLSVHCIGLSVR